MHELAGKIMHELGIWFEQASIREGTLHIPHCVLNKEDIATIRCRADVLGYGIRLFTSHDDGHVLEVRFE